VCRCPSNRFGRDCSLFGNQYDQSKAFRRQLCVQLQRAADAQDASVTSLQAQANAVAQVLVDPSVIDGETVSTCARVLIDTVTAASSLACERSGANLILNAMNALLFSFSAGNIFAMDMDDATRYDLIRGVSHVLQLVGQECLATQAVGDRPLEVSLDSVRLSSHAVSSATLRDTTFHAAQSAYERYVATSAVPVVTMTDDLRVLSGQDTMGVTILQYNNHPQQTPGQNSSVVYLFATTVSSAPTQRDVMSRTQRRRRLAQPFPMRLESGPWEEDGDVEGGRPHPRSTATVTAATDVDRPTERLGDFGDDAWSELLTVEALRQLNVLGVYGHDESTSSSSAAISFDFVRGARSAASSATGSSRPTSSSSIAPRTSTGAPPARSAMHQTPSSRGA
jgi:hypothetical protein